MAANHDGPAVERVVRTMAIALGFAALLLAFVGSSAFLAQWGVAHPVWTVAAAIGMFAPLLIGALSASKAPVRVLRGLAGTAAIAQLAALATYLPALPQGSLPGGDVPWVLIVTATGTTAAAVAWRAPVALGYTLLTVGLYTLDRRLATPALTPAFLLQDALYTLLFALVFVVLAIATHRAGGTLDRAADEAIVVLRAGASHEARERERSRVEALLHDTVLVALLASARGSARAAAEARSALDRLDLLAEEPSSAPAAADDWIWSLQALTTDLAPAARFTFENHDGDPIPSEAARALVEATAEALRNSVAHAGPAARAVHARVAPGEVEVTVLDDGVGFDPLDVRPERLGLRVSILDRLRSLPGGSAQIVARPGVGTRVTAGWRAR